MADIFISYKTERRKAAEHLAEVLKMYGYSAWFDYHLIKGSDFGLQIAARIREAKALVALWCPLSVASRWVVEECDLAHELGILIPVIIAPCELPIGFRRHGYIDLSSWDGSPRSHQLDPLIRELTKRIGRPPSVDVNALSTYEATWRRFGAPSLRTFALGEPLAAVEDDRKLPHSRDPASDAAATTPQAPAARPSPVSNIPIRVPQHFMGRDDALAAIAAAFERDDGRLAVAITALHGLRGVGKSTLAAAYAERHRRNGGLAWWIGAHEDLSLRAGLVGLGIRLGWVDKDEKEEPALAAVMERLRHDGDGLLLVFDNATGADALAPWLPRGGGARVLVTSNDHAWRSIATPVAIDVWPVDIGADFLIARAGRSAAERPQGEALSRALGGLPLAHEQAGAYCERRGTAFAAYLRLFEDRPAQVLDDARHAPIDYGRTVAKTFALAIDEAARLHPAAEPLILHAAMLAPDPVPLFLFAEARETFDEPLRTALADDGLDEAMAALRAFALVERETIVDERDASITTDAIRLHRLVREVAAQRGGEQVDQMQAALAAALAEVYPDGAYDNHPSWPRCAQLTPHVLSICRAEMAGEAANARCAELLDRAGNYFRDQAAHEEARPLLERALAIREKVLGSEHPDTAASLNDLAWLLKDEGDLVGARPLYERALAINEKVFGPDHPDTATSLNNFASLLQDQRDLVGARPLCERALAIREKVLGPEHPATAISLSSLARLLSHQGDLAGARPLCERALAIREKVLGPEHALTAVSLGNLASLLHDQGNLAGARPLYERAIAINEKALGREHPNTATSLNNLAVLLQALSDLAGARPLLERALAIREKALGREHPNTATSLNNLANLLYTQGDFVGARPLFERALAIHEKVPGPDHADTAINLNNLAMLLQALSDLAGARPLLERALAIDEKALGSDHPDTAIRLSNLARVLSQSGHTDDAEALFKRAIAVGEKVLGRAHRLTQRFCGHYARHLLDSGRAAEALPLAEAALAAHEAASGPDHPWTKDSARVAADALDALNRSNEAAALRARHRIAN
jgi:tetratricopeptide (TPR) repeat protein